MADTVVEEEKVEEVSENTVKEYIKKGLIRPICPFCNQSMIRFVLGLEGKLGATYGWLCGCIPSYEVAELPKNDSDEADGNK